MANIVTNAQISQILLRLHHDAKKPLTAVTMFLEIMDSIIDKPEELAAWKRNLLLSFTQLNQVVSEMQHLLDQLNPTELPHD